MGAFNVSGGLFDADNAGHLGQAHHRVVLHIGHGAAGNVVQHQRQINRLGDGLEMLEQTFLGGLVVIGHDLQLAIGTHIFGTAGQFDGLGCRVGAAARHDGDSPFGLLYAHPDDLQVFLHADRG